MRQEIRAGEGRARGPGFEAIPAVRTGWLREIKSPLILQPGPAALTDGLDALAAMIEEWAAAASGIDVIALSAALSFVSTSAR